MLDFFLVLFLSHLLTDFVFQTEAMVAWKHDVSLKERHKALSMHAGTFFITGVALFFLIQGMQWFTWPHIVIMVVLSLSHYLVDMLKVKTIKSFADDTTYANGTGSGNQVLLRYPIWLFLVDQLVHLGLILFFSLTAFFQVITWQLVPIRVLVNTMPEILPLSIMQKILILSSIIILVTSFTNIVIKMSLNSTKIQIGTGSKELVAGRYIGAVERILTIVAIVAGAYEAIAILFASKTAIRFSQIQESPEFRDYYIMGTLISALFGVLCGILTRIVVLS